MVSATEPVLHDKPLTDLHYDVKASTLSLALNIKGLKGLSKSQAQLPGSGHFGILIHATTGAKTESANCVPPNLSNIPRFSRIVA